MTGSLCQCRLILKLHTHAYTHSHNTHACMHTSYTHTQHACTHYTHNTHAHTTHTHMHAHALSLSTHTYTHTLLQGILVMLENLESNPNTSSEIKKIISLLDGFKNTSGWDGLFYSHTINELMWGYEDPLLRLLNLFVPALVPTPIFALSVSEAWCMWGGGGSIFITRRSLLFGAP